MADDYTKARQEAELEAQADSEQFAEFVLLLIEKEEKALAELGINIASLDPVEKRAWLQQENIPAMIAQMQKHDRATAFAHLFKKFQMKFDEQKAVKDLVELEVKRWKKITGEDLDKETATYEDYIELFQKVYPGHKKCLMRQELMFWSEHRKMWAPIANCLSVAKSRAMDDRFYAPTKIDDHFKTYQESVGEGELLQPIETWDGRDRIAQICEHLRSDVFDPDTMRELILDWGVKMVKRISDPWIRNRILCFLGPQNLGKDWLIDGLSSGIDAPGAAYCRDTKIDDNGEVEQKLHLGVVFRCSEFDRTAKASVSQLKYLVTATQTDERLKYDRTSAVRNIRASFIASANPSDLLRDPTGSTRFILIPLTKIIYDPPYPGGRGAPNWEADRRQIIAQYKAMGEQGFKAGRTAERTLAQYLSEHQPDDVTEDLVEEFDRLVTARIDSDRFSSDHEEWRKNQWIPNSELSKIFDDLGKSYRYSRTEIQRRLSAAGRRRKSDGIRGYAFNYLTKPGAEWGELPETDEDD